MINSGPIFVLRMYLNKLKTLQFENSLNCQAFLNPVCVKWVFAFFVTHGDTCCSVWCNISETPVRQTDGASFVIRTPAGWNWALSQSLSISTNNLVMFLTWDLKSLNYIPLHWILSNKLWYQTHSLIVFVPPKCHFNVQINLRITHRHRIYLM